MIREIRIAGVTYAIEYVYRMDVENAIAYIDFNKQIIKIDARYPPEIQKVSLLHEIIHGVSYGYNVGLSEDQVEKLSRGLYATMKDNLNYVITEG